MWQWCNECSSVCPTGSVAHMAAWKDPHSLTPCASCIGGLHVEQCAVHWRRVSRRRPDSAHIMQRTTAQRSREAAAAFTAPHAMHCTYSHRACGECNTPSTRMCATHSPPCPLRHTLCQPTPRTANTHSLPPPPLFTAAGSAATVAHRTVPTRPLSTALASDPCTRMSSGVPSMSRPAPSRQ